MTRYRFLFKPTIPFEEIDDTLMLATLAAECIYGRTRIHLDARFQATRKDNVCWIDADNEVGQHIARIFSGFMVRLFSEQAFKVERLVSDSTEASVAAPANGVAA